MGAMSKVPAPPHQGRWLKAQVERSGKSNAAFARQLGVSREVLQRWFNDQELRMRPAMLWRILEGLKLASVAKAIGNDPGEPARLEQGGSDPMALLQEAFYPSRIVESLMRLDAAGKLSPRAAAVEWRRFSDLVMGTAKPGEPRSALAAPLEERDFDGNVDPFSEQKVPEVPLFEMSVAAGRGRTSQTSPK
jgi:transcriptional regulator with XRE-family HTH domain